MLGWLGNLLRKDGAEPIVSEEFYRAVVQAVLIFGSKTLVLTAAMPQKFEGVHMIFLLQVMGMKARGLGGARLGDRRGRIRCSMRQGLNLFGITSAGDRQR